MDLCRLIYVSKVTNPMDEHLAIALLYDVDMFLKGE